MADTVVQVENVSKLYQLGEISTGTLTRDLARWWAGFRGKEDPFQIIGETNDRTVKGTGDYVWALKDISFEVKQGEILGIIGRNGAGKSTLLKILSRVTKPTTGRIRMRGRMASLLEVGTGFHPELTGRENIFLNGTILGMTRAEVRSKFDEIVDFAGIERYIDTPVKRYSSGMYVRLAFAVAAHLEPEILVIDEVLAVGDAEFQKKCLGKMKDVSEQEGRTILFVSHDMNAIQKLCSRGMLLSQGTALAMGSVESILTQYLSEQTASEAFFELKPPSELTSVLGAAISLTVETPSGKLISEVPLGDPFVIRIRFRLNIQVAHIVIGLGINSQLGTSLHTSWSKPIDLPKGEYEVLFTNDEVAYAPGIYYLTVGLSSHLRSFHQSTEQSYVRISEVPGIQNVLNLVNSKSGFIMNQMKTRLQPVAAHNNMAS